MSSDCLNKPLESVDDNLPNVFIQRTEYWLEIDRVRIGNELIFDRAYEKFQRLLRLCMAYLSRAQIAL
jgi:hypothetical protein